MVATGLKCDVECRACSKRACLTESQNFGMRKAGADVKTPADNSTPSDDDGADHRIGASSPTALRSETESQGHEPKIARHRFLREDAFAFTTFFDGFPPEGFSSAPANAAWAAASLAIATR